MFVLVTGDRKWSNYKRILQVLQTLPVGTHIVHGYADGADIMAGLAGTQLGFEVHPCPAHWSCTYERWVKVYGPCPDECKLVKGRPAGVIRNGEMLKRYPIDLVLAFHNDLGNSTGTKDMVQRAVNKQIKTALFTDTDQMMYSF